MREGYVEKQVSDPIVVVFPARLINDLFGFATERGYRLIWCTSNGDLRVNGLGRSLAEDATVAAIVPDALVQLHDLTHPNCGGGADV